ncbi:MAG: hypothetical protein ACJ06V_06580 [Verrucomicrobiota bacterium]
MANDIESIQLQKPKVSHAVEMRNRALAMRLRTANSYGVGNPEINQILGLGRLPRQNIIIDNAERVVAEFSPRRGTALMGLAEQATARAGRALPRG